MGSPINRIAFLWGLLRRYSLTLSGRPRGQETETSNWRDWRGRPYVYLACNNQMAAVQLRNFCAKYDDIIVFEHESSCAHIFNLYHHNYFFTFQGQASRNYSRLLPLLRILRTHRLYVPLEIDRGWSRAKSGCRIFTNLHLISRLE